VTDWDVFVLEGVGGLVASAVLGARAKAPAASARPRVMTIRRIRSPAEFENNG
jgi:hypothetical protein